MRRLGIVDLGSNTARLVVYAYEPGLWYRLEDEIREPVRLAEGFGREARLSPGAMARTAAALELFADFAGAAGLDDVEVIATSALRDAVNRDEFFARIAHLGLKIAILSGRDEAELGVLAVANGLDVADAWVVDLGGGSLEVSRMVGRRFVHGETFPLGMVRLTERYLADDPPGAAAIATLERELATHLELVTKAMRKDTAPIVAVGGTARNLARAVQKKTAYPLELLHGYTFKRRDLAKITDELAALPIRGRSQVPGIRPDRADVILAGALLFRWVLAQARRGGMIVSGQGLREGWLYRRLLPPPHLKPDVRAWSVESFLHHYPQLPAHVAQVRRLARRLFDELAPLHQLGETDARLLDAAAALHDVGSHLAFYRHAHHGVYALGAEPLAGFSHREQVLILLMVKYHEKSTPKPGTFAPLLEAGDALRLQQLTACLRLAEHLERARAGRVADVRLAGFDHAAIEIHLEAAQEPVIEIWEAQKLAGPLFETAFSRSLVLRRRA